MRLPKDYSALYYFMHIISILFSCRELCSEESYSKVSVDRSNLSCQVRLSRYSMGNFCGLHFENNSTNPLLQHTSWAASFAGQANTAIMQKSSTGLYTWYICVCTHTTSINMYDYIDRKSLVYSTFWLYHFETFSRLCLILSQLLFFCWSLCLIGL